MAWLRWKEAERKENPLVVCQVSIHLGWKRGRIPRVKVTLLWLSLGSQPHQSVSWVSPWANKRVLQRYHIEMFCFYLSSAFLLFLPPLKHTQQQYKIPGWKQRKEQSSLLFLNSWHPSMAGFWREATWKSWMKENRQSFQIRRSLKIIVINSSIDDLEKQCVWKRNQYMYMVQQNKRRIEIRCQRFDS